MSNKGIFTALSGAIAQSQRLDTIANNMANVNTSGFKKDEQTFYEYVTANEKNPDVIQVPRVPASVESFYDMQGGDRGYVDSSGTYTNFAQGPLKATGNRLDLAIEGEGFFEVDTPQGVRWTRSGNFQVNAEGLIVDANGYPVLRAGIGDPAGRHIVVNSPDITVGFDGEILAAGESLGDVSVVVPAARDQLMKAGQNLWQVKPNANPNWSEAANVKLHQGYLENSNVNIVQEMTNMISATRAFESTQQAIKAFDSMNEKLVNVVPRSN